MRRLTHPDMQKQPVAFLAWWSLYSSPTLMFFALVVAEMFRTLPAELRIYLRAKKRRCLNAGETFFLTTKYFLFIGMVTAFVFYYTNLLGTVPRCIAASYVKDIFLLAASYLTSLVLAWRCYIIFGCNRRMGRLLIPLMLGQLAVDMYAVWGQFRPGAVVDGICSMPKKLPPGFHKKPWPLTADSVFFIYSLVYDGTITAVSCWRLVRAARGPNGFAKIGRILFHNNVHYLLIMSSFNVVELFMLGFGRTFIPPFFIPGICVQCIIGINMLASEQDAVYNAFSGSQAYRLPTSMPAASGHGPAPTSSTLARTADTKVGASSSGNGAGTGGNNVFAPLPSPLTLAETNETSQIKIEHEVMQMRDPLSATPATARERKGAALQKSIDAQPQLVSDDVFIIDGGAGTYGASLDHAVSHFAYEDEYNDERDETRPCPCQVSDLSHHGIPTGTAAEAYPPRTTSHTASAVSSDARPARQGAGGVSIRDIRASIDRHNRPVAPLPPAASPHARRELTSSPSQPRYASAGRDGDSSLTTHGRVYGEPMIPQPSYHSENSDRSAATLH